MKAPNRSKKKQAAKFVYQISCFGQLCCSGQTRQRILFKIGDYRVIYLYYNMISSAILYLASFSHN